MSIVLFLIILAVLVLSHEFGHFIVAKLFGVRVDEFGFGFPPRIFGKKWGETLYSLNALPFGGFVKIFGEDPDAGEKEPSNVKEQEVELKRNFSSKPRYIQSAIILAGVVFNLLLAWGLFSIGFMTGMPVPIGSAPAGGEFTNAKVYITGVSESSPAAKAGIKAGDNILYVSSDGSKTDNPQIEFVQNFINSNENTPIKIGVKRGAETLELGVMPKSGIIEGKAAIGISMDMVGIVSLPIHRAVYESLKMTLGLFSATIEGLAHLFVSIFSGGASMSAVSGPIGIIGIVKDAYGFGFIYLLGLTALISINLAVINIIPFPALDGGRFLFILIEAIRRKPLGQNFVNAANATGFFVIIALMLFITYHDLLKLAGV
ncbi:MAG: M50 family metallopeptidase [Candidatus Paceibacterota bacterium]|jgi:regulator of sigma E protease